MTSHILTAATEALKAIPSFHGINEYTLERAARAVAVAVLEHAAQSARGFWAGDKSGDYHRGWNDACSAIAEELDHDVERLETKP